MAPQKKKTIAFKSTPVISDDEEEEEDDEELSLLVRNVRRMYNNAKSTIRDDGKVRKKRKLFVSTVKNPDTSWLNVQFSETSYLLQSSKRSHL